MTPLLLALSVIGGLAVVALIAYLITGATKGWKTTRSKQVLTLFLLLGALCGILGVVVAFTQGG